MYIGIDWSRIIRSSSSTTPPPSWFPNGSPTPWRVTGEFLAPALLVKFGDDRERFPTPAGVRALAGSCPVTEASEKGRRVRFRRGCDREFRYISQQWAWHSLKESAWASTYYQQALERGLGESHALRLVNENQ